jgi:BMFP domain-containing protein YqiC
MGVIVDTNYVSELARKLARAVPGTGADLDVMRADLERNFRGLLAGAFERMDLVTREEFDVQRRVLERSREKLAKLEVQVAALEQQSSTSDEQSQNDSKRKRD